MSDRTIFVGDLHGCHAEAVELMRRVAPTPRDRVIYLGDFVDRGPDNGLCCDLVREREQVQGAPAGILGNHEEKHIFYDDTRRKGRTPHMSPTHVATHMQLTPAHYDWFRTLPLFIRVEDHVAVHAGVYPGRKMEDQLHRHLLHCQMIRPYGAMQEPSGDERSFWPSKVPFGPGWKFWTNFWTGPETIVFGHTVLDRPLVTDKVVGIDGGAVFGRQLHAYVLPERTIVSVQGKVDNGRRRDDIGLFPVHAGVNAFS